MHIRFIAKRLVNKQYWNWKINKVILQQKASLPGSHKKLWRKFSLRDWSCDLKLTNSYQPPVLPDNFVERRAVWCKRRTYALQRSARFQTLHFGIKYQYKHTHISLIPFYTIKFTFRMSKSVKMNMWSTNVLSIFEPQCRVKNQKAEISGFLPPVAHNKWQKRTLGHYFCQNFANLR